MLVASTYIDRYRVWPKAMLLSSGEFVDILVGCQLVREQKQQENCNVTVIKLPNDFLNCRKVKSFPRRGIYRQE
jgi:hypothetical protein